MLVLAPSTVAVLSIQWGNTLWPVLGIWVLGVVTVWRVEHLHICATYVGAFVAFSLARSVIAGNPWLADVAPITGPMYQLFVFFMITDPKTTVGPGCGGARGGARRGVAQTRGSRLRAVFRPVSRRSAGHANSTCTGSAVSCPGRPEAPPLQSFTHAVFVLAVMASAHGPRADAIAIPSPSKLVTKNCSGSRSKRNQSSILRNSQKA